MIPKEKIEQLAEERFGFNSATENYKGWVNGFECGVSFAETELQSIAIEFAEWISESAYNHYEANDNFQIVIPENLWHYSLRNGPMTTSELFAKFMAERQYQ